jgi:general secretion pathway protein J
MNIKSYLKINLQKGFTLIEVMVALLIFAIVGILAAQGLKTLMRSHEIIHNQSNRLEELQIAQFLIERNLSQTIDRSITDEQNIVQPALTGTADSIEFTHGGYTNPQGAALRSTLQRTAYFLSKGELIQRNWPVLDRTTKTVPNDRSLIKQVTGLRFRYYDNLSQPHISWPPGSTNQKALIPQNPELPRAVEMTITLAHFGELSRVYIIQGKSLSAIN